MAFIDIDRTYQSNKVPTQQDLDYIVDGIETFLNVTGASDDNFQDSTINATTKLIDGSVTLSKVATDAVGTDNLQVVSVTADKLSNNSVQSDQLVSGCVTASKITGEVAITANIIDGAVDPVHITPNRAASTAKTAIASVGLYYSLVNTVQITTNGGPVLLFIPPVESSNVPSNRLWGYAKDAAITKQPGTWFKITRDATVVATNMEAQYLSYPSAARDAIPFISLQGVTVVDIPSAGSYTYSLYMAIVTGTGLSEVLNVKLQAWEL